MAEMRQITVEGQRISYRAAGAGPVVVLLHCSSSHSGQWAALIEEMSSDFLVLAPDFHGYGRSEGLPGDGRPYFERDGAIVRELAVTHGAPVHLVGHSLGGTVALHVAVKQPELLASLTLIEPVQFSLLEEVGAPEQAEFHEIATTTNGLIRLKRYSAAARRFVDFWVADGAYDEMDDRTKAYIKRTIERLADDWAGVSAHAPGQLRAAQLAAVSAPCLILCGGATRASARAVGAILHDRIVGSDIVEVADVGHMGVARQPEKFNPVIAGFLNAQSTATATSDGKEI